MNTDCSPTDPLQKMQGPDAESICVPKSKRKSPEEKYASLPEEMRAKVRELFVTNVSKIPPFRIKGGYIACEHPDVDFTSLGPVEIVRKIVEKDQQPPIIVMPPPIDTPLKGPSGWLYYSMPLIVVGIALVSCYWLFQSASAPRESISVSVINSPGEGAGIQNAPIGPAKSGDISKPFSVSGNSHQSPTSATPQMDPACTALDGAPVPFPSPEKRLDHEASALIPPVIETHPISDLWKSISDLYHNKIQRSVDASGNCSETISESLKVWAEYREALPQLLPIQWAENWRANYWPVRQTVPWSNPLSIPIIPAKEFGGVTEIVHVIGPDDRESLAFRSDQPERLWAAVQVLETGIWRSDLVQLPSHSWILAKRGNEVVISVKK